jgi:hypothetical protein
MKHSALLLMFIRIVLKGTDTMTSRVLVCMCLHELTEAERYEIMTDEQCSALHLCCLRPTSTIRTEDVYITPDRSTMRLS